MHLSARTSRLSGTAVPAQRAGRAPHSVLCTPVAAQQKAGPERPEAEDKLSLSRRGLILNSNAVLLLGSVLNFTGERPGSLGIRDLGGVKTLGLCPKTPNCISTAEEANDPSHFVPPWTYNPQDTKRGKNPISQEQAMSELLEAIKSTKPDGFEPTIVKQTADYVYVEYQSPFFGFVDDVEFWFVPGSLSRVEYRSASRLGADDANVNRKRIKALREALQKKGWRSVGF